MLYKETTIIPIIMNPFQKILTPKPLFFIVLALYALFGSLHLTEFVTADEHYWLYERVPKYWNAWGDFELRKTFINDKPGVSVALVTGPALLVLPDTSEHCVEQDDRLYDCQVEDTAPLLFAFRLPLLIANGLILVYLFFLLSRLFGPWTALFASILTALSPVLIGMTQIVNPDALLWSTSAAALFSFFAVLQSNRWQDILATIVFTTLALLSKYTALILFPAFALAILIWFFAAPEEETAESLRASLIVTIVRFGIVALTSATFVLLFVPAFLLDRKYLAEYLATVPDKEVLLFTFTPIVLVFLADLFLFRARLLFTLRYLVRKSTLLVPTFTLFLLILLTGVILARSAFPSWGIYAIPFDIKDITDARYDYFIPNFFEAFFLEWHAILFSLTPIFLGGLIALAAFGLAKKSIRHAPTALSLSIFAISFTVVLIHSNILATARYAIMLFPLLALLAAFGLSEIAQLGKKYGKEWRPTIALLTLVASVASLLLIYPFYANYANTLLPKQALVTDAWGYGGYEAAEYLNTLPNASELTVWSDYYGVCEFFVGKCLTAYTFDGKAIQPDYYVLTRRGRIRYSSRYDRWEEKSGLTAYRYYDRADPAWSLEIDNRPGNYVKVFKVEK